jgi:Na+/proline symporter
MSDARSVIISVGALYFVAVAGIGLWASRRTRTVTDFYLAGRGIGLVTLTLGALSATLSGFAFIGGPGLVQSVGLGALFIVLPAALTNALSGWVLAPQLRRLADTHDVVTIPEALGVRFSSRAVHGGSAVALLIAVVGYMATNVLALGLAVDTIFGTGLDAGIWMGTLVVVAYAAGGGIIAGLYTDVLQGLWMAVASTLVFIVALRVGPGLAELSRAIAATDPGFLEPWGHLDPLTAVSFFFVFSVGVLGQPHVLHKFYMLRDPQSLRWYPLLMSTVLVLSTLLLFGVGMAVKALVATGRMPPLASPDQATPRFLLEHTPALVAALALSGVVAAIMSTLNSFVNIGAAALTHDLPRALGHPVPRRLAPGRWATVALCVAAAVVAQLSDTLVAFLGIFGWGLFASTLVPGLALGLNWPRATHQAALASIATGLIGTLALESAAWLGWLTLPAGLVVSALTLVASLLVFVVVSWATGART